MHTQFLAGVVFAWVVAYIGIGVSFCVAYLIHRREPEHLLFGLHSLALAIYSIGLTLGYTQTSDADARFAVLIGAFGGILAAALLVHFALLYARIKNPLPLMRPVYAMAAIFEIANAYGLLFKTRDVAVTVHFGPIVVEHTSVESTSFGALLCVFGVAANVTALAMLTRATLRGRRDGLIPLIGATCMMATTIHDSLLALGIVHGTWLGPFGNSAFVFSITGAFLIRSSVLSKELTDQSLELKRRSGELRQSYEELREAQRELTRKEQLAAVGELAAVIAHEVRNPLAIISNAVAGLRRREIGHEDRETLLAILKEESSRLNRLVGDLLRYARPVNVHRQLISVREIIERTLTSTGLRDAIPVDVREEGEIHSIWGDPGLLRQVFDNLIENAVQAMGGLTESPTNPGLLLCMRKLSITLRSANRDALEGVHVEVQDTGEGMDPHVRLRAKDPFFTTRPSGTGLGLAIVDRIVEAHDGEISITSRPGSGTTVSVFLPIGAPVPPSSGALLVAREEPKVPGRRASLFRP
ncbi:MAG TPA: ATP-binding protein [Polyangiaceae bacterium]